MPAFRGKDKPISGGAPDPHALGKRAKRTAREGGRARREDLETQRTQGGGSDVFHKADMADDAMRAELMAEGMEYEEAEREIAKRMAATIRLRGVKAAKASVADDEVLDFWRKEAERDEARKAAAAAAVASAAAAAEAAEAAAVTPAQRERERLLAETKTLEAELRVFGYHALDAGWSWGSMAEREHTATIVLNRKRLALGLPIPRDLAQERIDRAIASITSAPAAAPAPAGAAGAAGAAAAAPAAPAEEAVAPKPTYYKAMDVSKAHADHTLRIGDLPFDIQWSDLKALFDGVGVPFAVRGCAIARDRNMTILTVDPKIKLRVPAKPTPWDDYTKSPKGGAFVKFDTHAQAERALLKLQGNITMRCSYMGTTKRPHIDWAATDSK